MKESRTVKALIKNLVQYGGYIVFALSMVYLTLLGLFSTSTTQLKKVIAEGEPEQWESYNYFLPDSPWKRLAVCTVVLILLLLGIYVWNKRKGNIGLGFMCLVFFIGCVIFIWQTKLVPISDSGKILNIARQLKEHNFEQFAVGGYMDRYPDQTGIVLLFYVICCIFGDGDYLFIQIGNAALLAGAYYVTGRIAGLLWGKKNRNVQDVTILLCTVFFPAWFYVTLVYGTIPGFAFGIFAFYLQLRYLDTGRLGYMVGAGACISFAIVWKTNSLIMFIAMCIYLVYDLIIKEDRRKKTVAALLLLVGMNALTSHGVNAAMEGITGMEVSKGMPKTAWVSMGLMESSYAPGVWNGHSVSLFEEHAYDYDATNEAAIQEIVQLLKLYASDLSYGVDFFGRKNAMQWNDPTFHCLAVIDGREPGEGRNMEALCEGPLRYKIEDMANSLQSVLLLGGCFYLLLTFGKLKKKELHEGEWLLGITVIGGLLFHMLWEGKPQYVLPYFWLLLPYSAAGFSGVAGRLLDLWEERKQDNEAARKKALQVLAGAGIICLVIGLTAVTSKLGIVASTVHIQNEPQRLAQYEEAVEKSLQEYESSSK